MCARFIYTTMPTYLRASTRARAIQFVLSKQAILRVLAVICHIAYMGKCSAKTAQRNILAQ